MVNERDDPVFVKIKMALNRQQDFIVFHSHRASDDQIDALKGLSALGPLAKASIPAVAKLVIQEENSQGGLFTLARIGPDAIPALIQLLQAPNRFTRNRAAGYLSNFKEYSQVVVPALLSGLDDPDESFVEAAAIAVGGFGRMAQPAVPKLLQLAHNQRHQQIAIYALMSIDCEGALQSLLGELQSTNAQARAQTAESLRWFGSRGRPAVPTLLKCLKDGDQHVRAAAVIALGDIGQEPDLVVPALLDNLNSGDMMWRTWNVIALASFGERAKPAVPVVLSLIEQQNENESYRAQLQRALEKIDSEKAAPLAHRR
jgi:HEAT repeat protein